MGDQRLFDELMANPEALEYVLRQSPEFLDRLAVHNLSPTDATQLVGHLSQMQRLPIPPNLPTPANLHGLANEVDMRHLLEGHTWDYLNPATRGRAPVTTLWPQGTTPEDVSNYLQEALDKLNKDGVVIQPRSPVHVTLADGTIVQVGVRFDSVRNKTVIGQFYPVSGAGLIQIPKSEMRIISDMLNP